MESVLGLLILIALFFLAVLLFVLDLQCRSLKRVQEHEVAALEEISNLIHDMERLMAAINAELPEN